MSAVETGREIVSSSIDFERPAHTIAAVLDGGS